MSERFAKEWEDKHPKRTLAEHVKKAFRSSDPLKPRLDVAVRRLRVQISKLDEANIRFSERDKSIFTRIVQAYTEHDMVRARVFANELVEIRKMERTIMHARLALEQIVLRLRTVSELGDVVSTLGPAVKVLGAVKVGMANIFPEADREFGQIGNILSGVLLEAGQSAGVAMDFGTANEGAQQILTEARVIAEQKIKENLPELPSEIPSPLRPEKSAGETS